MKPALPLLTALLLVPCATRAEQPTTTLDLGSRRELFVDSFLIDTLTGVTLKLHEPQPAPPMTEPADHLEYGTVIQDGGVYRLYTREARGAKFDGDSREVTRYCESRDGIHWTRPKLSDKPVMSQGASSASSSARPILETSWPSP